MSRIRVAGAKRGPRGVVAVGVGAVLIHEGRVLLIRRGKPPLEGRWVVPGGTVELGETLEQALVRELREETGLAVRPRALLTVFDRIQRVARQVVYHYVILDYLCDYLSGTPRAGSDALELALVRREDLPAYDLPAKTLEVVQEGFRRAGPAIAEAPGAVSRAEAAARASRASRVRARSAAPRRPRGPRRSS